MSLQLHLFDGNERTEVALEMRRFPAGETFLRVPDAAPFWADSATVELHFQGNDDLFNLALLVDALRRKYDKNIKIRLYMPYLPYARQDRVCAEGESLSIKVVADFINGLKLEQVKCFDIHSNVGEALLDNLLHDKLDFCVLPYLSSWNHETTILVSPDAGANKKVLSLAKDYGFPHVVRADKTREPLTNKIIGTVVYSEHVGNKDFLIVDDICDGGRTFIELAKELRKLTDGKVMLYVTHGIFSAGMEVFDGLLDRIFVANLMNDSVKSSPLITNL